MRKAYLLVYNDEVGTREQVRTYIDSLAQVINWRIELPNSMYLISESSAEDLATLFRKFTLDKGRFLITELGPNRQGWLPPDSWTLFNEKHDPRSPKTV
jgi:hypothetical protein